MHNNHPIFQPFKVYHFIWIGDVGFQYAKTALKRDVNADKVNFLCWLKIMCSIHDIITSLT